MEAMEAMDSGRGGRYRKSSVADGRQSTAADNQ